VSFDRALDRRLRRATGSLERVIEATGRRSAAFRDL
jgi:hypothetical protein